MGLVHGGFYYSDVSEGVEQGVEIDDAMATIRQSIPADMNRITMEHTWRFLKSRDFRIQE